MFDLLLKVNNGAVTTTVSKDICIYLLPYITFICVVILSDESEGFYCTM